MIAALLVLLARSLDSSSFGGLAASTALGTGRDKQDVLEQQIDEYLRQFQAAAELQQGLAHLSSQLTALGAAAANPIARRLADDLRDGMVSASVPALLSALSGRPQALAPLQAAFRDAATSAAGRIELAVALAQLDDSM